MNPADLRLLRLLFAKNDGNPWEPPSTDHPFFDRAIYAGYLRRVDGRCGFERFKDSHVCFTEAGKAALTRSTTP